MRTLRVYTLTGGEVGWEEELYVLFGPSPSALSIVLGDAACGLTSLRMGSFLRSPIRRGGLHCSSSCACGRRADIFSVLV